MNTNVLPAHQESGLAKLNALDEDIGQALFDYLADAQTDSEDVTSREKAREILLNNAGFTTEELSMFAVFDKTSGHVMMI